LKHKHTAQILTIFRHKLNKNLSLKQRKKFQSQRKS